MSEAIVKQDINEKALQDFYLNGDLSVFQDTDKVKMLKTLCLKYDLDPVLKPIDIIPFQKKHVWYVNAKGVSMLAAKHVVSFTKIESSYDKETNLASYTVRATLPSGKWIDAVAYVACVVTRNMKEVQATGQDLANIFMKVETKAKRRATADLVGLPLPDEEFYKENLLTEKQQAMQNLVEKYQTKPELTTNEPELYDKSRPEHKKLLAVQCRELGLDPKVENDKQIILLTQDLLIKEGIKIDTNFMTNVSKAQEVAWSTFYQLKGQSDNVSKD